ncbi:hypothetical protein NPIL_404351 [Nephila pilipes]|uniref:Uncharacterized protein n=1 Tax=Nephila pilipes TaxID=299642 RepID=A0A8X6TMW8_NEPPI|nr:hypothetical protein NPIL_404351 [Nephila pilipes]
MVNAKAQNDSARCGACFYRERDAEVVSDASMPLIRAEMASEGTDESSQACETYHLDVFYSKEEGSQACATYPLDVFHL